MNRVLLVSPSAVPGGAERALLGIARELPKAGWRPTIALLQDGALADWLREENIDVVVLHAGRTRQLRRTAQTIAALVRLARNERADVVLSNMSKGHVYGGVAALAARTPEIWWQHEIPNRSRIEVTAAAVPSAAIVCVSDEAVRAQRRLSPRRRIEKIHPGVPLANVAAAYGSGASIRYQLGWTKNPILGVVGRLQPWKGQDVFLRAAALVAETHPDARFAVVGGAILGWEGDYPERLRELASELRIAERVHFAGHQADGPGWLDALDVVVHTAEGEPFGLVLVEALSLGKPLVATAGGGPREIVCDGENALVVEPRDPEQLAAAMRRLLDEPALAAQLAAAGPRSASPFSEENSAERFGRLLDSVTEVLR